LNFNLTTNSGENTYLGNVVMGGCEANNVLGTGASSSLYTVNAADLTVNSLSLDDCTEDIAGGSTAVQTGGWVEPPGQKSTPYPGVYIITVENSLTNSFTGIGINFLNDTSTLAGIPPAWIDAEGHTTLVNPWAQANGSANSVPLLVHTSDSAYISITGFDNSPGGGSNPGVTKMINTSDYTGPLPWNSLEGVQPYKTFGATSTVLLLSTTTNTSLMPTGRGCRMMTLHHRKPKSLGGRKEPRNITVLTLEQHRAWHRLFQNMPPERIADEINEKFIDPDFELIVRRRNA
jgi:hypothetical protein